MNEYLLYYFKHIFVTEYMINLNYVFYGLKYTYSKYIKVEQGLVLSDILTIYRDWQKLRAPISAGQHLQLQTLL